MNRHLLRPSPCGEATFVLKGVLMILDDLMSNVANKEYYLLVEMILGSQSTLFSSWCQRPRSYLSISVIMISY